MPGRRGIQLQTCGAPQSLKRFKRGRILLSHQQTQSRLPMAAPSLLPPNEISAIVSDQIKFAAHPLSR